MPIRNYEGRTFVAFVDISGFKELMSDEARARNALNEFYQAGFNILYRYVQEVEKPEGFFISDCGVLFIRGVGYELQNKIGSLKTILKVIRDINKKMIEHEILLTTSIAYGQFRYQERHEYEGIVKTPIYGDAYVDAFLDNEKGKKKIEPGQCRIIKNQLPEEVYDSIIEVNGDDILSGIKSRQGDNEHFYYYWMAENQQDIDEFEHMYRDAYNQKFRGMITAIKATLGRTTNT